MRRRTFLAATAGAAAALAQTEEVLVLTNGRIYTMDRANTVAASVTIANGRIRSSRARHHAQSGAICHARAAASASTSFL
jgi:adenine deaminase